ncbi:hypothetical protein A8V01_26640 [Novosphingobium guangzhouense]|uniref:Response regulatory domain-containing protein n=1 Tax=Novosphingobium guangzhouense TaxID=1850347 RepID=A0A2K2FU65_9SPHN|nr:hypothetical protein A8V01_26640 [Novosphingobium guangzhouense]
MRINSVPGEGTRVTLYLPVAGETLAEDIELPAQIHHGDGESVLLVEDDASVRMLVSDVLNELGYKATEVSEPEMAVRLLADGQKFDLLITDVGLPGMNGRQLAEIVRNHLSEIPILFITGYAENAAIRADFLGTNMQMIAKPFQIEDLLSKIAEMLERS